MILAVTFIFTGLSEELEMLWSTPAICDFSPAERLTSLKLLAINLSEIDPPPFESRSAACDFITTEATRPRAVESGAAAKDAASGPASEEGSLRS